MSYNRTAADILWQGYCQAVTLRAPLEMSARLLGAHRYAVETGCVLYSQTKHDRAVAADLPQDMEMTVAPDGGEVTQDE